MRIEALFNCDSLGALLHGSLFTGAETLFGPLILGIGVRENNEWAARFSLGDRF